MQGLITIIPRWDQIREGSGDATKILRWHEWVARAKERIQNATVSQIAEWFEAHIGEPYTGELTKRAIVVKAIEYYFGIQIPPTTTLAQIGTWLDARIPEKGRWGLGCPHMCGRFWEFKPIGDLTGFEPSDPAAIIGAQPKTLEQFTDLAGIHYLNEYPDGRIVWEDHLPEPYRGYLNWRVQADGSILFLCDRCGKVIKLVK